MATPATKNDAIGIGVMGAFIVVGSFLPWVRAGIFSVPGTDGDGIFTLIAGVLVIVAAWVAKARPSRLLRVMVLMIFAGTIWTCWGVVGNANADPDIEGGTGLFLTIFAAALGIIFGLVWLSRSVPPPEDSP